MAATPAFQVAACEIAIVGGGIAGGALATAAARAGKRVVLLERTARHEDRVRGEFMPVWGVQEAEALGLLDVFLAAGAHWLRKSVGYGEDIPPSSAEARMMRLDALRPGIPGALTFGHPQVCTALNEAAVAAGAALVRNVDEVAITPGAPPTLGFRSAGRQVTLRPQLVVGADGRGSRIARAIGGKPHSFDGAEILCGVLVDGVESWPDDQMTIGTDRDLLFYVFPRGQGRVRLYAGHSLQQRGRFAGPDAAQRLLDSFQLESVPGSQALASARLVGPCHGYRSGDTWVEQPGAPGVVLIGDAAGHNCPTIGQGVSLALRDVRHVMDAVANGGWSLAALDAYAGERAERMRRLRFLAELFRELRADFSAEGRSRRERVRARASADPSLLLPFLAVQLGPHSVPAEVFTPEARARLLH